MYVPACFVYLSETLLVLLCMTDKFCDDIEN